MIKVKKQLSEIILSNTLIDGESLELSLIVKLNDQSNYFNGQEVGLENVLINGDQWRITDDHIEHKVVAYMSEIKWVNSSNKNITVIGYYVANRSSILFYDIFKESIILEPTRPLAIRPSLSLKYDNDTDEFDQEINNDIRNT